MSNTIYEGAKDTAKKIRVELKKAFPGVKFSVRSSTYSMGSSVDVSWTDLPRQEEVDAILDKFQSGYFDGMQDMYISGAYEYEGKLYHGAKHVSGQRNLSAEYKNMLEEKAIELFEEYNKNNYRYYSWLLKAEEIIINEAKEDDKETTLVNEIYNSAELTIILNEEKNGIELKFTGKPSEEIRTQLKSNGFRWSKPQGIWYAKQSADRIYFSNELLKQINKNETVEESTNDIHTDDTIESNSIEDAEILDSITIENTEEVAADDTNNNPYEHDTIEAGYIYNCHFKAWNYSIDELKAELTALNINYYDMVEKVGFKNVSYETMLQIENLNNKNGSILFIDSKVKTPDSTITDEDRQTVETLLDYSVSIIEQLQLNHSTYAESQEYKIKLVAAIKQYNIKLTKGVLQHLVNEGYGEFEKVLKDLLTNTNFDFNNVKSDVNSNDEIVQEVATANENITNLELIKTLIQPIGYNPIEIINRCKSLELISEEGNIITFKNKDGIRKLVTTIEDNHKIVKIYKAIEDIETVDNLVNYNDPEVIAWENSSNKYIPIEFNNIEIIDVLDKNIFVNCLIPSLNKNCNKVENDKEIQESSYLNKFLIQRIVKLNLKQYNYFIDNLLHDYSFLTGLGGWQEDDKENLLYYYGVAIVCDSQETLIIDPECSSFAKYTCQLVEDINGSLQAELNTINTTIKINNNLYNEAMNSIVNSELYEIRVSDEAVINDNRYIKNIPCNGLTVVTGLTIKELINEDIGINILNLQPLQMSIESFKQGLRKHDNKEIFSLFPSETDKQIENIKFMERLEHELNRARIKENITKIS